MRRLATPLGLAVLVLVLGLPALPRYGVTWDEALGDFFFGERYLDFYRTLDPVYLDFAADPYPAGRVPDLSVSPFRDRPWEYYPAANAMAAATARLFAATGWLDPFDGFHALGPLLCALLLAVLYGFVRRRFDPTAAAAACALLLTSPRLVAHALANVKDVPEMALFALTLFAFTGAWERGSAAGMTGAGVLWGLALATKANALFLPAIVALTLAAARPPATWRGRRRALFAGGAGFVAAGLGTAFALWPYLWAAPWERVREHLEYIGLRLFATRPESVLSPLRALLYTTPLPFLGLALLGAAIALRETARAAAVPGTGEEQPGPGARRHRRRVDPRYALPLSWVAVTLGRMYLPGAVNFDGVRHFLELFPALAILAGIAATRLASAIAGASTRAAAARTAVATLLIAGSAAAGALAVVRTHPFELAWWNALAGGLDGARARGLAQAGDYWAAGYRTGLDWLDAHAPEGAALAVPVAQHTVTLVAPSRLRPDIGLVDLARPEVPELRPGAIEILDRVSRQRPVLVMFTIRDDWTNELVAECTERLSPLVRWTVDDAPVLVIYRWSSRDG